MSPVAMARAYYEQGADELVFYDITASNERRGIMIDVVRAVPKTPYHVQPTDTLTIHASPALPDEPVGGPYTIGPDGRVTDAKVIRSVPLLDAAALDAVKQWVYTPTTLNGQPVPVIMTVTVNFALR